MGEELVSESSSVVGSGDSSAPHFDTYTKVFDEAFPTYLIYGMTYEQYWNDDSLLVKYYRKAFELKREYDNQVAWIQGMYFYEALADVAPVMKAMGKAKLTPYRKEPYDLSGKGQDGKPKLDEMKSKFEAFAIRHNRNFRKDK